MSPRENAPLVEIGAGAYVLSPDGRLLLVEQERGGVRTWGCVGGGMEHGESIEVCAVRETREEAGLRVRITKLLSIDEFWDGERLAVVGFLFLAEPEEWPQQVILPGVDGETLFHDHGWFGRDDLDGVDIPAMELCLSVWPADVGTPLFRRFSFAELERVRSAPTARRGS